MIHFHKYERMESNLFRCFFKIIPSCPKAVFGSFEGEHAEAHQGVAEEMGGAGEEEFVALERAVVCCESGFVVAFC